MLPSAVVKQSRASLIEDAAAYLLSGALSCAGGGHRIRCNLLSWGAAPAEIQEIDKSSAIYVELSGFFQVLRLDHDNFKVWLTKERGARDPYHCFVKEAAS